MYDSKFDNSTLPPLNLSLLTKQLDWAEVSDRWKWNDASLTKEETTLLEDWGVWRQGSWAREYSEYDFCGTAYCQAGQAVVQAGYQIDWVESFSGSGSAATTCVLPDGNRRSIEGAATEVLGLTDTEAGNYFGGDNTLEELRHWMNVFAYRRDLALPYPDEDNVSETARDAAYLDNIES